MVMLKYIGQTIAEVGVVPLEEGWAALDHEEPDPAVAKAKLASGKYEREKPAKPGQEEGD